MLTKDTRIFLAGHRGMVGSGILRCLESKGYENVLTAGRDELDLLSQADVRQFMADQKPGVVIVAAARVGGIQANRSRQADFIYENLQIQNNLIHEAYVSGTKTLCFLGSSCIYPRECPQPMKEEHLLTGPLEPTNQGYAIAKIAGLKMAEYYEQQYGMRCVNLMPCNLYGYNDSFDLEHSHVLSALVRRFAEAFDAGQETITLWGSGIARREFLNVEDMARITVEVLEQVDSCPLLNVGSGKDITIKELAHLIAEKVGYQGAIEWDTSRPDGMLRKCMDISRMTELGLAPKISLEEGVEGMITHFRELQTTGAL